MYGKAIQLYVIYISILFQIFFSIIGYYKILSVVLCAVKKILVFYGLTVSGCVFLYAHVLRFGHVLLTVSVSALFT